MQRAELDHLIDPAHLRLYVEWQSLRGQYGGLSLTELLNMPAAMRHDFALISRILGEERAAVAARRKAKKKKP